MLVEDKKLTYICETLIRKVMNPISTKLRLTEYQGVVTLDLSRTAIGMVMKGKKVLHHNDKTTEISTNNLFILSPGIHYEENMLDNGIYEQVLFYLSAEVLQKLLIVLSENFGIAIDNKHSCANCRANNFCITDAPPTIALLFNSVSQCFAREEYRQSRAMHFIKLADLVLMILLSNDLCFINKLLSGADMATAQFTGKVYDNMFNDISIEQLAEQTNRSLTSFKKEFKRQFECPPHQWFVEKRLQHAKLLLHSTSMTISEIGNRCAFSNISHFIKLFKRQYKTTPAAMRKKLKEK